MVKKTTLVHRDISSCMSRCSKGGVGQTVPHAWGVLSPPRFLADAEGGLAPLAEVRRAKNLCHGALAALAIFICLSAKTYAGDKIIAVVNKDIITQSEADSFLNVITLQLSQEYQGDQLQEKINEVKKDLITRMIEEKVILQEAKRKKIMARADKVKSRIEQIKEGFSSEADFENAFKKRGLSLSNIEEKLSEQIIMNELIQREINDKIIISPEEVTKFYEQHKDEFAQPEERVVEALYTEEERTLDKLIEESRLGIDFQSAAKSYKAEYARETISAHEARGEIVEAVFSLKLNETTKPIKIDGGFYIFKLIEIIKPKLQDLVAAHNKICNYLYREKFNSKMTMWIEELKSKSHIEIR